MPDQQKPDAARGARIKARRETLGLTQQQLATAMGLGAKGGESVRRWEKGEARPDLQRLSDVLVVRLAWLAAGEEPMLSPMLVDREQLDRVEVSLARIDEKISGLSRRDQAGLVADIDEPEPGEQPGQDDRAGEAPPA